MRAYCKSVDYSDVSMTQRFYERVHDCCVWNWNVRCNCRRCWEFFQLRPGDFPIA
jgi:hypothetical protein